MYYKIKMAKAKAKQATLKKIQLSKSKKTVESDSDDGGPTYAIKLADNEVDKLQSALETL